MTGKKPTKAQVSQYLRDKPEETYAKILGMAASRKSTTELRFRPSQSFKVILTPASKKGRFQDFLSETRGDPLDCIAQEKNKTSDEAWEWALSEFGLWDGAELPPPESDSEKKLKNDLAQHDAEQERLKKIHAAERIVKKANHRFSKNASAYLANRAIDPKRLPSSVRHQHIPQNELQYLGLTPDEIAQCPGGLDTAVFVATTEQGDTPAVQRVMIKDGRKFTPPSNPRGKVTTGRIEAPVRFGDPQHELAMGEGPETGLSWWQETNVPTWVMLGGGNLARVPVPTRIKRLIFIADGDGPGISKVLMAAGQHVRPGLEIGIAIPDETTTEDWNDIHQKHGGDAVRAGLQRVLWAPRCPDGSPTFVCYSPKDALAVWLATGWPIHLPAPGSKFPERGLGTFLASAPENGVVLYLKHEDPEPVGLDDLPSSAGPVRILRAALSPGAARQSAGLDAVRALVALAPPAGINQFYGIDDLLDPGRDLVIISQNRLAADAARKIFPTAAALAHSVGRTDPATYDWSVLKAKSVLLAPAHCAAGQVSAAIAAAFAIQAGARDVRVIEWPIIVPAIDGGFAIRDGMLPKRYDMQKALEEGWREEHSQALLDLAVRLG